MQEYLPEEQPSGNQTFISLTWWFFHDVQIRRVEAEGSSWQTISYLINHIPIKNCNRVVIPASK